MKIVYFVKDGCDACKKAREKVEFFLGRWGVGDGLDRESFNLSTVDGLVEAAMREVHDIPTVVLEQEGGTEVARWIRRPPDLGRTSGGPRDSRPSRRTPSAPRQGGSHP